MNQKALAIIGAITLVLIVAASIAVNKRESTYEKQKESPTENVEEAQLPELMGKANSITKVVLERNDSTVTLNRKDNKWFVEENNDYHADEDRITKLIRGLDQFQPVEQKTSNPDWYDRLGLMDPEKENSTSTRLKLYDENGKELAILIVGNYKKEGNDEFRYIRMPGNPATWLVKTRLDATGDKDGWCRRKILSVLADRVRSVDTEHWDGEVTHVDRLTSTTDQWRMSDVPEGAILKNEAQLANYSRNWENTNLMEVKPASAFHDEFTSETLVTLKTFDGLILETRLRQDTDQEYWAMFHAEFDPSLRDGEEDEDNYSIDYMISEVEGINTLVKDWTYKMPGWKVNQMTAPKSQFVEIPQKPLVQHDAADLIRASHILIAYEGSSANADTERTQDEALEHAKELRKEIMEDPTRFAEIASRESNDLATRDSGGDLGTFGPGTMVEAFDKAAFALKPNEISDVVETEYGYHIIERVN